MLRNLPKFASSRYFTLLGSNVFSSAEKHIFKQSSKVEKSLITGGPLVIPSRGMRGVKSMVLHKEVIDKHRLKKLSEEGKDALLRGEAASLTSQLSTLRPDDEDMPVPDLQNPYEKPPNKCLLCEHDVELDYKNTRLLSQFVSPHTGRIYGRSVTGLCLFMQRRVSKLIKRSQYFGFMPYELKDPHFLKDPKLFDPFKRK